MNLHTCEGSGVGVMKKGECNQHVPCIVNRHVYCAIAAAYVKVLHTETEEK